MRTTRVVRLLLWSSSIALCLSACGSDSSDEIAGAGGAGGTSGTGGGNVTGPEDEIGVFGVQLVAPVAANGASAARPGSTVIVGSVGDKPDTESKIWELQSESGDCALLVPRVPFCDPSCGSGEVCVEDGMCVAERASVDVGAVTVRGVTTNSGADSVTLVSQHLSERHDDDAVPCVRRR